MPVAGAIIGGAVAGPVGMIAGAKVARVAAISATIGGSILGKYNSYLYKHCE